ncbi:MAG: translation initiation factor IF-3 [Anaerolineales bacterium]
MSKSRYRINRQIPASEVRVITGEGENLGVKPIDEALDIARAAELDLVEVAPNANPPVTRVMDFGKFLYEQSKKEREARKAQKQVEVKEIRLRPKTNEHHLGFKIKNAREWLEDGNKVKVRVRFRGREITYPEVALEQLNMIIDELADIAVVEQKPQMDGRTMLMLLGPDKK